MDKRVVLSRIIRAMLTLLVLAFLYILFRSLSGPSLSSNTGGVFDNVVIGQTALRRISAQRVWVTRLSKSQVRERAQLDEFVIDATSGCKPEGTLCVVAAESSRSGIDIVYTSTAPAQLPRGLPWYGGFVDPVSGGVFDLFGRALKGINSNEQRDSLERVDYSENR